MKILYDLQQKKNVKVYNGEQYDTAKFIVFTVNPPHSKDAKFENGQVILLDKTAPQKAQIAPQLAPLPAQYKVAPVQQVATQTQIMPELAQEPVGVPAVSVQNAPEPQAVEVAPRPAYIPPRATGFVPPRPTIPFKPAPWGQYGKR